MNRFSKSYERKWQKLCFLRILTRSSNPFFFNKWLYLLLLRELRSHQKKLHQLSTNGLYTSLLLLASHLMEFPIILPTLQSKPWILTLPFLSHSLQCKYAITQQVSILINISQFSALIPESLLSLMHPLIFCCMSNILEHISSHITALFKPRPLPPGGPSYCQGQTQTEEWCIQCSPRLDPWLPFMPHCS